MHVRLGDGNPSAPGCWTAQLHEPANATGGAGAAARAKGAPQQGVLGTDAAPVAAVQPLCAAGGQDFGEGSNGNWAGPAWKSFFKNVQAWSKEGLPAWGRLEGMHR